MSMKFWMNVVHDCTFLASLHCEITCIMSQEVVGLVVPNEQLVMVPKLRLLRVIDMEEHV